MAATDKTGTTSGKTLTARRLVTGVGVIEYPVVRVDGEGRIAEISSDTTVRSEETLTSAFFDVHTHGAAGHDLMDAGPEGMAAIGRFYAGGGELPGDDVDGSDGRYAAGSGGAGGGG